MASSNPKQSGASDEHAVDVPSESEASVPKSTRAEGKGVDKRQSAAEVAIEDPTAPKSVDKDLEKVETGAERARRPSLPVQGTQNFDSLLNAVPTRETSNWPTPAIGLASVAQQCILGRLDVMMDQMDELHQMVIALSRDQ